jgi:hypothetical protein
MLFCWVAVVEKVVAGREEEKAEGEKAFLILLESR